MHMLPEYRGTYIEGGGGMYFQGIAADSKFQLKLEGHLFTGFYGVEKWVHHHGFTDIVSPKLPPRPARFHQCMCVCAHVRACELASVSVCLYQWNVKSEPNYVTNEQFGVKLILRPQKRETMLPIASPYMPYVRWFFFLLRGSPSFLTFSPLPFISFCEGYRREANRKPQSIRTHLCRSCCWCGVSCRGIWWPLLGRALRKVSLGNPI